MSSEQAERKRRSESILKNENIPFNDHLPAIQSSAEVRPQSESEVVQRALCLTIVAAKGEGIEQDTIDQLVSHYGLTDHFTPGELAFIEQKNSSPEDKLKFVWRYESAWVMLWALGFVETLDRPDAIVEVVRLADIVGEQTTESFREAAKLRSVNELLDQADLIYRYHWAIVNARLSGAEPPGSLDCSVVYERHYSFNWLLGCLKEDWDDVSTNT